MQSEKKNESKRDTVVIKRYQNRKLYDTRHSIYVTLDDIAKMIREGEDVQIVDNKTNKDMTAITLTQIIFEEEKKNQSVLPLGLLKKIIHDGGDSIKHFFENALSNGISQINQAGQIIKSKIESRDEKEGDDDNFLQGMFHKTQDFSKKLDDRIRATVESVSNASVLHSEIKRLRERVIELEKKVSEDHPPTPRRSS